MKKKDQLSQFMVRELLYDYAKGKLEGERKAAFEKILEENGELKLALKNLQNSLDRLKEFESVEVTEQWKEELSLPHPSLAQQLVSFEKRLAPQFWRTLPIALVLAGAVIGVSLFKPWKHLNFQEVEVAQVSMSDDDLRMEAAIALSEKDIESAMKAQETQQGEKLAGSGAKATFTRDEESGKPEDKASEKPSEEKVAKVKKAKKMGELYRGFLSVDDLMKVTEATVLKIETLGGKKAGQVPLGWKRDEDERYFHFSIPEKNKQALLDHLSNFGQVRLSSQEHPLVMPEGKIRIILVVKQNPNVTPPTKEESSNSSEEMAPKESGQSEQKEATP
ncbi:MAG TPA: hypothetical protein DCL41_02185 [Bdellovibrionales bacterium]|nr:hypothetical protein [Pseudobdellovibrionaceae bacterium]HAG90649.1 hypothetical protein [Bdellovibrionales bacterium]|tara:strand:- start:220 stop:1221 length:1002 start_codon:yes stop_codon:yes gene_type:complete